MPTPLGELPKEVELGADWLRLTYGFSAWGERPVGSLRTGVVTLLPETFAGPLEVVCANGGPPECFELDAPFDHGAPVSALVTARAAFGATSGVLAIRTRDGRAGLELCWEPHVVAALPLVTHGEIDGRRWCRIAFSLGELDETHRPGAPLADFRLVLRPLSGASPGGAA